MERKAAQQSKNLPEDNSSANSVTKSAINNEITILDFQLTKELEQWISL